MDFSLSHEQKTLVHMVEQFARVEVAPFAAEWDAKQFFPQEYPIERFFRDLRVHQILEGTNEIMQLIIARHLLD